MKKLTILRTLEKFRYRVSLETIEILRYVAEHPSQRDQLIVFDKTSHQSKVISIRDWSQLPVDFDLALRHQKHLLEQKLQVVKALQAQQLVPTAGARIRYLNAWN